MTYRSIRAREPATEAEQEAVWLIALKDFQRAAEARRPFTEQERELQQRLDLERTTKPTNHNKPAFVTAHLEGYARADWIPENKPEPERFDHLLLLKGESA